MRFHERTTGLLQPTASTNTDYTVNLNDIGAADTFTITLTRVGDGVAATTGTINYNASQATIAADMQAAIRALTGFGTSTVTYDGTAQLYSVILTGSVATGTDYTLTVNATGFTPGSHTKEVAGSSVSTVYLPIGRFATVRRIRLAGWKDNSLDVNITDNGGAAGAKTVFAKTAIDTYTGTADSPYDELLTADGIDEGNAATANAHGGLFEGPLKVVVTTSGTMHTGSVTLFVASHGGRTNYLVRKVVMTGNTATLSLGAPVALVRRIRLTSSADTTVRPTITDANSKVLFDPGASQNYTTALDEQLSVSGVDQAGNAVAGLVGALAKGPVSINLNSTLGSGTFTVELFVEA